ncbi:S-norcoclaurine synthase 1-like [Coffea arabica]|uniref:S-norcoclaurine synthase 1-like n=1 Tax=Coffea arabica TaxID=13443 RepID=A0A6P6VFF6_COFAR|nr:S-norcoclaurine synthase 1-like [Coffea arabica]
MGTEVAKNGPDLGSLPVENVQELASNCSKEIPHRYIRPEMILDKTSTDESSQVPVIDMENLATSHSECQNEMAKLHQACKEFGFFQLVNHGASMVIEKMKVVTEDFFKLPLEQKMACAQVPNHIEGYGQTFVVSEDQKLDWGDMLFLFPLPVSQRNMRFWPNSPTSFRSTLDEYSLQIHKVCMSLFKLIEANLGLEPGKLCSIYQDGIQGIRMNYYPPCRQADKVFGASPHSDGTGLTLLVQVNDVQGLQIKKSNTWVPIKPIPGAIIVNIGDMMEIMSNGEYRSIEHRAVVDFQKERLSIAAFHNANLTAKIGPLPELVKENGAQYKTIGLLEFFGLIPSSKLDGKSPLDRMRIDN